MDRPESSRTPDLLEGHPRSTAEQRLGRTTETGNGCDGTSRQVTSLGMESARSRGRGAKPYMDRANHQRVDGTHATMQPLMGAWGVLATAEQRKTETQCQGGQRRGDTECQPRRTRTGPSVSVAGGVWTLGPMLASLRLCTRDSSRSDACANAFHWLYLRCRVQWNFRLQSDPLGASLFSMIL